MSPVCPNCGTQLEWIELDNGQRVADDCPVCFWTYSVSWEVADTDDLYDRWDD